MVIEIIQINTHTSVKKVIADEGKELILKELLNLNEPIIGVPYVIIPIEWDEKELYIENEIPEEVDLNNIIEK